MSKVGPSVQELFDMTGRVALVTGGRMGLGLDEASALADLGAQVVITSRSVRRAQEAAELLSSRAKVRVVGMRLDVTDKSSVTATFEEVFELFGRLDVLVNNAGGVPGAAKVNLLDRRLEDWNAVISTNLTGTFLCSQAAALIMKRQGRGSIINISSIAGIIGRDQRIYEGLDLRPNFPDYAASKAGVLGLTRENAAFLGRYGIRVNAILPGGFRRELPEEFVRRYSDKTALGRMGRDGYDIKGAVVLLASDAGAYITGEGLVVDGGFSIFK